MIKLKSILIEQTDPNLGFAKYIVGNLMDALSPDLVKNGHFTWDKAETSRIDKLIHKIKTQEQYDAVLKLCKTSKVLRSKFPVQFPFNTIMELIHTGISKQSKDTIEVGMEDRGIGSDYFKLDKFASYLKQFNLDEKIMFKPMYMQ
jgi:hypothetical protein